MLETIVIIGASFAGLVAAQLLSSKFPKSHIVILERDRLPSQPLFRKGVPQDHHVHNVSGRAIELLYEIFPGLEEKLDAIGAPRVRWGLDVNAVYGDGVLPQTDYGFHTRNVSRSRLEFILRQYVNTNANVEIITGVEVTSLEYSPDNKAVTGVFLRGRRNAATDKDFIKCDVVIDASGRNSRLSIWLAQGEYNPPAMIYVDSQLTYSTVLWKNGIDLGGYKIVASTETVQRPTAGLVIQLEEDAGFLSTFFGVGGKEPEDGLDGYLKFALESNPVFYKVFQNAEGASPVYIYKNCRSVLIPYWEMSAWPKGLYAIGDSINSNNPRYGQGISSAVRVALHLPAAIESETDGLTFLKKKAKPIVSFAWSLATGADFRFPTTQTNGDRPGRVAQLTSLYTNRLEKLVGHKPAVARAFMRVSNDMDGPAALFSPSVLKAVIGL
jgi:hypothetical protein